MGITIFNNKGEMMIRSILIPILLMGVLTGFKNYENKIQWIFENLTVTYEKSLKEEINQDILDSNPINRNRIEYENAIDRAINVYLSMPKSYSENKFWITGTESIIRVAFLNSLFSRPYNIKIDRERINYMMNLMNLSSEFLINIRLSVKNPSEKFAFAIITIPDTIKVLRASVSDTNLTKSESARLFLESLRSEVRLLSDDDRKTIITDPVIKEFIDTIKFIEMTNKWPTEL